MNQPKEEQKGKYTLCLSGASSADEAFKIKQHATESKYLFYSL